MDNGQLKELKKESNKLKAEFNLGRKGDSDTFIDSVQKYLKAHQMVKIKVIIAKDKSDVDKYSQDIAKKTNSTVLVKKGFTFTLYKENEN